MNLLRKNKLYKIAIEAHPEPLELALCILNIGYGIWGIIPLILTTTPANELFPIPSDKQELDAILTDWVWGVILLAIASMRIVFLYLPESVAILTWREYCSLSMVWIRLFILGCFLWMDGNVGRGVFVVAQILLEIWVGFLLSYKLKFYHNVEKSSGFGI